MGIFDGLMYGRPAYPYQESSDWKSYEPKSVGLLTMLMGKGKSPAKGKDDKIKGDFVQERQYYDMQNSIESKQRDIYNRYSKLQKDNPNDWYGTPEGIQLQKEITAVTSMINTQKANVNRINNNFIDINKAKEDINNPELMAKNQYLYENGTFYTEDIPVIDPNTGQPKTENGRVVTEKVPIKKADWLERIQVDENWGLDQYGVAKSLKIPRAVKGDQWKIDMDKMYTGIKSAQIRESGEKLAYNTPGYKNALAAGKILVQSPDESSNYLALDANYVESYLQSLNPDSRESLDQMYMYLKLNQPNALKNRIRDDKDNKFIYVDKNGKDTKDSKQAVDYKYTEEQSFNGWVGNLIANENQRNLVTTRVMNDQYLDIPDLDDKGDNSVEAQKIKYWANFWTGKEHGYDPVTGESFVGLDYDKSFMDWGIINEEPNYQLLADVFGRGQGEIIESIKYAKQILPNADKKAIGEYVSEKLSPENKRKLARYISNTVEKITIEETRISRAQNMEDKWSMDLTQKAIGFVRDQKGNSFNPLMFLTEEQLAQYPVKIHQTPTGMNEGMPTQNWKIPAGMQLIGQGGITFTIDEQPGTSNKDSRLPVMTDIVASVIMKQPGGRDDINMAIGRVIIPKTKEALASIKYQYYDVNDGKWISTNAAENDKFISIRKSTAGAEMNFANGNKSGYKDSDDVYVVYLGMNADKVTPNIMGENRDSDLTKLIRQQQHTLGIGASKAINDGTKPVKKQ